MSKIIVLGAGMVGSAIALDLAAQHDVTAADQQPHALSDRIRTVAADFTDLGGLAELVRPFDVVVAAVPGFLGFDVLRTVIEAGKNVVDISFFSEDALTLHETALHHGVTAIVDMGVAPGMDNLILGYHDAIMEVTDFECLVGGLPKVRSRPFEYKAPFSPIDVIEEYTRPARYVENGHVVTKPAMTDIEPVEFEGIGTLESFNTDGLRSLIATMPHIPNMKEKTLRYPGHIQLMRALRDGGFFERQKMRVGDFEVVPLEVTSRILFDRWKLRPGEQEFTVMRVTLRGTDGAGRRRIVYHLFDEADGLSSMARTTGFACTAAVNLVLQGKYTEKGVSPPELVGRAEGCFHFVMQYLRDRNVIYRKEEGLET